VEFPWNLENWNLFLILWSYTILKKEKFQVDCEIKGLDSKSECELANVINLVVRKSGLTHSGSLSLQEVDIS